MKFSQAQETRLDKLLRDAQKRCSVRMFSVQEVKDALNSIIKKLPKVSKKALVGTEIVITRGGTFSSRYKGIPESTYVKLEISPSTVKVIQVDRFRTQAKPYSLKLSETARAEIIANLEAGNK